jgi:hypothetical protein
MRLRIDGSEYPTKSASNQAQSRARLRRQFLVERLHRLGPSPLCHFLAEIERGADLRSHLDRYAALPADFVRVLGGDRFPPALHVIDGDGR